MSARSELGVGIVGLGYWGPNLIRNFSASPAFELRALCDLSDERRAWAAAQFDVPVLADFDDLLATPGIDAVVIATPPQTHAQMALAALEADKHVLVEKPLATSSVDADKLVVTAEARGLTLMCDHTYCYTPAVREIRRLIEAGELGEIQYFDSVRVNLGLIQDAVDVLWDLAPHDLSILDFVLPPGSFPGSVSAHTADPLGVGQACIGYLNFPLPGGGIGNVHVNWLSPTKIRKTIIAGTDKMLVWDDLEPQQRLTIYDRGVERLDPMLADEKRGVLVSYRIGALRAPALPETEALSLVVAEFGDAIVESRSPTTDGRSGLRVVQALAAAATSAEAGGAPVRVGAS